ncbi:MAG: monovalent cation:proton antiporter-2 (CPA2) family protein [Bacteroidales bacterium]|nr:monovalent cation:proton antiporter-2 (CPA2) family protein [Bacteroidales bacterium]
MEIPLINEFLIILGLSVIIVFALQKIKLPSILGFLITGIIIGPYALSLIGSSHEVEIISEIGVILLLFVIGMELSLKQLVSMRKTILVGGTLQVGLSIIAATLISKLLGFEWNEAVFAGFLLSLSSTAIVLKILQDRNEISAPHGRNALAILIFQDIIVIPMILLTPILSGESSNIAMELLWLLLKTVLIVIITFVSAKYIVPKLMFYIAKTKSKELLLIFTLALCFAVAFLTAEAGLSLALGAFLAGLIISESDYGHQATSMILPFKELFTSFFFISIGMLLDLNFFIENIAYVMLLVLGVFIVKSIIAAFAAAVLKYPPRVTILTGLALFQIGEFAFILSREGVGYNLLSAEMNQYFLAVSIITMFLTPFIMLFADRIATALIPVKLRKKAGDYISKSKSNDNHEDFDLENHLVIIGYGINGRNVAKAAGILNIPYVIIEMNAETVKNEKANGERILYGDAGTNHILQTVNICKAKAVVIAISDTKSSKYIVSNIRAFSQSVYIIVRTRYVSNTETLLSLGADDVIPEEFETSIAILGRLLQNFFVPVDEIDDILRSIRSDNYEIFKNQSNLPSTIKPINIPEFNVTCVRIDADSGKIVGKSIIEAKIREKFGVNILAISRNNEMKYPISPDDKLLQNDFIYISGDNESIDKFYRAVK